MAAGYRNDKADCAQPGDREGPSLFYESHKGCKKMARIDTKNGNLEKEIFT